MPVGTRVRANRYVDSVTLMTVSRQLAGRDGVREAVAAMATELNKDLLEQVGLLTPEARAAGPGDLVVAVEAESEAALEAALEAAEALLERPAERAAPVGAGPDGARGGERAGGPAGARADAGLAPRTLKTARRLLPEASLALVSVPGTYAAYEARLALCSGLHVLCYSSDVPVAVEAELKRLARARGLLLMGPDCGTAILEGIGLGLANAVRRGPIGIVAASGSGAQELSTLIHRLGSGVSHCIGTGGRDGSAEVGGLMLADALGRLQDDPETRVVVLLSKPPAPAVAARLLAQAEAGPKPVVPCLLGPGGGDADGGGGAAVTPGGIDRAAVRAVHLATGRAEAELEAALGYGRPLPRVAAGHPRGAGAGRRYVRGLFSGGTLCQQALEVLEARLGPVWSNVHPDRRRRGGADRSREHTVVDLGEARFVAGRPHPIIDPTVRRARLRAEAADPEVAVVLLDVVLGHGGHPDPAGALAAEIRAARDRGIAVVASVTGTDADPQRRDAQVQALEAAGAAVLPTARLAAEAAAAVAGPAGARAGSTRAGSTRPGGER